MKKFSVKELPETNNEKRETIQRQQVEKELRPELFGEAIKKVRKAKGLTQKQLGELVGVQKAQIAKIENAVKDARLSSIVKVFNALQVKVNFIVEQEA